MLTLRMLGPVVHEETAELRPVIRAVVSAILGADRGHPDVEDCTHEALRRAIEGRDRLRPGEPMRPWVIGIARHVALDVLRERRTASRRLLSDCAQDEDTGSVLDHVQDPGPSQDDRLERAEQHERIARAMRALPDRQRQALLLFHTEGLGYQQIAERLEVPLGTVATWILRGRQSIASALADTREA